MSGFEPRLRVEGLGLRVWGLGFRVGGLGFRVTGRQLLLWQRCLLIDLNAQVYAITIAIMMLFMVTRRAMTILQMSNALQLEIL